MAEYAGLTADERLVLSGMNFCFEEAAQAGDRSKMVQILVALEMLPGCATKIVDAMFASPASDEA